MQLTEQELSAIEARYQKNKGAYGHPQIDADILVSRESSSLGDIPALIAEVRELRHLLDHANATCEGMKKEVESEQWRCSNMEAQRGILANLMADGAAECPYQELQSADALPWCQCTDTTEDGFDCTENPARCWTLYADQEAAKKKPTL
jgi:hypothetical protein